MRPMSTIRNNTVYNQIFRPVERTLMFVAREAGEYARNDPALAMRFAATNLVPPIMNGVNPDIAIATEKTIVPVMRTGLLALNTLRCIESYKNPDASYVERGMDTIRVISDTAGFLGGLAMLFTPQYAALGAKMIGSAYAVDIVSHAFRGLTHANRRIQVWQTEQDKPSTPPDPPKPGSPGPSTPTDPESPGPGPGVNKTLTVFEQPRQLDLWGNKAEKK